MDLNWLSNEARQIYMQFQGLFYVFVTTLLIVGVVIEYFKIPLGGMPSFGQLIARVLIAVILLQTYPMVSNTVADFSDALARQVGDLNKFDLIRAKLGEKFGKMSVSWLSVKESITIVLCYIIFLLFHFSYYMAEAFLLFAWYVLYIFSPLLIALFVLPATAGATKGLYRSLIELSFWKPVWSVMATLLWSLANSEINKPDQNINFLSVISLVLILGASLLLTPKVVHMLAGAGITSMAGSLGQLGMGALSVTPLAAGKMMSQTGKRSFNITHAAASKMSEKYFPKFHNAVQKVPRFNVPKKPPLFEKQEHKKK